GVAPLGPLDYLAITRDFHTVMIDAIPILSPARRNEARRFMILIDALYEHKVNLLMSAAAIPNNAPALAPTAKPRVAPSPTSCFSMFSASVSLVC
ncbi:MAG: cell division protein ZapE, partial [Pleurocapsa sp. SU_196_0]|nr:cell division protein ZapE [Pleurocapsa sp. SU_196_0]